MLHRAAVALAAAGMVGIAAAWLVRATLAFPVRVASASMEPYAARGDFGVAAHGRDVQRGDVVVFHYPFGTAGLAIKRAAILEGECMPPQGAGPNGAALNLTVPAGAACATVPGGAVFVLGDNMRASIDSRSFGPVPAAEIVGKVVLMLPKKEWSLSPLLARVRQSWRDIGGTSTVILAPVSQVQALRNQYSNNNPSSLLGSVDQDWRKP